MRASNAQVKHAAVKQASQARMRTTRGTQPKYDRYGCITGDRGCDAQQLADDDAVVWGIMGATLGVLGAVLLALGAAAGPFGAFVLAAGWAFIAAGLLAASLAFLVSREASHPEAWFYVKANLTVFAAQVTKVLVALTAFTAVLSTYLLAIPPAALAAGGVKIVSLALGIGFLALFTSEMHAQEQVLGYL